MRKSATLAEAFEEICRLDAPLNARIAAYAGKLRELDSPMAEAYDALVARLRTAEFGAEAPVAGQKLPPFVLPARSGRLVCLADLTARGPVVINFNRGHWCRFCRMHLRALADIREELASLGADLVSIMPDRQEYADRIRGETFGRVQILTDVDNAYALSLGLVVWLGDRLMELLSGRNHYLDTYQGGKGWFVPLPATFVVDRDGCVAGRFIDPDFRKRMEIAEIIAVLRACHS